MARASHLTYQGTGINLVTQASCSHHPCWLNADIRSTNTSLYAINEPQGSGDPAVYSYEVFTALYLETAPDNKCENYLWFGPSTRPALSGGEPNSKITILAGTTTSSSHTPTSSASSIATVRQDTNYYSLGTGLAIECVPADDVLDTVGEQTWWCVTQLKVEYGSGQGNLEPVLVVWAWEES